jgi:thiamine biosynthesis lipoprotein
MKLVTKNLLFIILTAGAITLFGWLAFSRIDADPVSRTQYIMGTLIEITAYGVNVEPAIEAAFSRMREIERAVGRDENSDISLLNTQAGGKGIKVGPDTWRLLTDASEYWKITDKAFDVTVGPLVDLWGFGYEGEGRFPIPAQIQEALPRVGSDKLALDPGSGTARLEKNGMTITVGGIAKGYAVEEAIKVLKKYGVDNAMVNGGSSSIKVIGPGAPNRGWRVGIGDPRQEGKLLGVIKLQDGEAIGTSADDKRYFIKDGRRYSHIIDPRTGYPANQKIALVTIITRDATVADILTKALFLNDPDWSMQFLQAQKLQAVIVSVDGKIRFTPGLVLEK